MLLASSTMIRWGSWCQQQPKTAHLVGEALHWGMVGAVSQMKAVVGAGSDWDLEAARPGFGTCKQVVRHACCRKNRMQMLKSAAE